MLRTDAARFYSLLIAMPAIAQYKGLTLVVITIASVQTDMSCQGMKSIAMKSVVIAPHLLKNLLTSLRL